MNRPQPGPEFSSVRRRLMRLKGALDVPRFDDYETIRPARFLEDEDSGIPFFPGCCHAIFFQKRNRFRSEVR